MDEDWLRQESNISDDSPVDMSVLDDPLEKDDVIDVLHVYSAKNDKNKHFLKKCNFKALISDLMLCSHKKIWHFLRSSVINMFLPFLNGVFLGFGEIFAHEVAIRWNLLGAFK